MAIVAASGYAAVLRQPLPEILQKLRALARMQSRQKSKTNSDEDLVNDPEWLLGLSAKRKELQQGLRAFADKHASEDMRGWWKSPQDYLVRVKQAQRDEELRALAKRQWVTADMIEQSYSLEFNIPLNRNKRSPLERAVLTSFMEQDNTKALLWIPGRNDSFYHVHILDRLLATGFDVHALDLRRCGRAKVLLTGSLRRPLSFGSRIV